MYLPALSAYVYVCFTSVAITWHLETKFHSLLLCRVETTSALPVSLWRGDRLFQSLRQQLLLATKMECYCCDGSETRAGMQTAKNITHTDLATRASLAVQHTRQTDIIPDTRYENTPYAQYTVTRRRFSFWKDTNQCTGIAIPYTQQFASDTQSTAVPWCCSARRVDTQLLEDN